jgi:hypothetical protein
VDPDAPYELVAEAYWYLVNRLKAEQASGESAAQQLAALNTAYAVLVDPEQRRAYDETVARVVELRRARAERRQALKRRPVLGRFFERQRRQEVDCFELLRVDPLAEPLLIDRAYSIMRALYSTGSIDGEPAEQLALLAKARTDFLARFQDGLPQQTSIEPAKESPTEPPEFLMAEHTGTTGENETLERHE